MENNTQAVTIQQWNEKFNSTWNKDDYYISSQGGSYKLITKKDLNKAENNEKFLQGLWLAYKEGNQLNTIKGREISNMLDHLLDQLARANDDSESTIKEQLHDALKTKFKRIIEENKIYYVANEDKFLRYDEQNRRWIHYKNDKGLFNFFKIVDKEQIIAFKDALEELGHVKEEAVNTFKPVTDNQLNFCSTKHWLKPKPGIVHDAFKLGFKALCGEKQEAQDKLEHTIAWKYLHPEEYKLPMFAFNGEGGVLKNEILIGTLGVVFGQEQVVATSCADALEGFNGEMLGKTIVLFDESKIDKTNYEKLKARIQNEKMNIEVKFGVKGSFDNTPLYFAGSNEITGAVRVGGSSVDRRFSIVTVRRNIMEICAEAWGTEYDKRHGDGPTVEKWFKEYEPALRDPEKVAIWLNSIIEKWKDAGKPMPYHGEDYDRLVQIQKSAFDHTMEWIFNRDNFEHISDHDAYLVFQAMTKRKSPATGSRMVSEDQFWAQMDYWLENNHPEITRQRGIKWRKADGRHTNKTVYKSHNKTCVKDNQSEYLELDVRGVWQLVDMFVDNDDWEAEDMPVRRHLKDVMDF
ncbi:primase-helicase family protein [Methylobacter sp.]|uniref:primase-helicase family protein n=1 Tax=Methylobacter sp. TaxID=2051955 RepID=UPI003DA3C1E5